MWQGTDENELEYVLGEWEIGEQVDDGRVKFLEIEWKHEGMWWEIWKKDKTVE